MTGKAARFPGRKLLIAAGSLLLAAGAFAQQGSEQLDTLSREADPGGGYEAQSVAARFEPSSEQGSVAVPVASRRGAGGSSATSLTLAEKAVLLESRTRRDNQPWLGLILNRKLDARGNTAGYDDFGDSLIWTGTYIAAEAQRCAVTGSPDALEGMERSLWGLDALQKATGVPGLVARVLVPPWYMDAHPGEFKAAGDWRRGAGSYKDWLWQGDLSLDQYDGYVFGIAAAWPYIRDPALRDALREDLRQVGLNIIRNDMRLEGGNGDATFLDFRANYYYQDRWPKALRGLPLPPWRAGNSVQGLHIMKVCALLTQDPRLLDYYTQEMILNRELDVKLAQSPSIDAILHDHQALLTAAGRAWSGQDVVADQRYLRSSVAANLEHMALYDLSRLETDPGLKAVYQDALAREHHWVADEGNSYWNFLYAASFPRDRKAVADGVDSLRRFPERPVYGRVQNSADPSLRVVLGLTGDTAFPPQKFTDHPLPFERRPLDTAFAWQGNPYRLDGGDDEEGSGTAYLAAYWLGRRQGFIAPGD